ncbi:MAG TPA: alpha-hydroxy acid oxidase [Candidatus Saccharimonadales bacterium]|nr:alpha-hydroxy acid oxidase [Candidatus Saccharimonadales bacterium]
MTETTEEAAEGVAPKGVAPKGVAAELPGQTPDAAVARPPYLGKPELDRLFSVEEFEPLAAERMHPTAYDYVRGWAGTGWTDRQNALAFRRWVFRPRVLVDVSRVETATTVLGTPVSMPILFAPTSVHRLAHPDGELATARAARQLDTLQVLSTGSSISLEAVAQVGPKRWFQLYWYTDRELTRSLIERAAAAGYSAIVLTVDASYTYWRENEARTPVVKPEGVVAANLPADIWGLAYEPTLTWKSLAWLRSISPLPLVLKGIVRADDAHLAAERGVDGIIVSNHGGRQVDGAIPTLDALPAIAAAAAGAGSRSDTGRPMEVYLDGGVRRGTDVLKALALGARAVLLGRPVQWGLAAGGEAGIVRMLELISGEFHSALGLVGATRVDEVTRAVVTRNPDPTAGRG